MAPGWDRDTSWIDRHLVARGLVERSAALEVTPLGGGVSAEIFEVRTPERALVVKRALADLSVADTWIADPRRTIVEGKALRLAGQLAPQAVPPVVDLDEDTAVLVMERAPESWREWRAELLAGRTADGLAAYLGEVLAVWHRGTAGPGPAREPFADRDNFEKLRLEPFHGVVAAAHPELSTQVADAAERLRGESRCLVHGDFSPKNVLSGPTGAWVLDWEVAHLGAPIFDLAFLLAHLALKSVHRPLDAGWYRAQAAAFLGAYADGGGLVDPGDPGLAGQVGCLLLARVDGKSPAQYLTPGQRDATRRLGIDLLSTTPAPDALGLWGAIA